MAKKSKLKNRNARKQQMRQIIALIAITGVLLIAAIAILIMCLFKDSTPNADKKPTGTNAEMPIETTIIYNYNNAVDFEVSFATKTAKLYYMNEATADKLIKYTIAYDGVVIYESPKLSPGAKIDTAEIKLPSDIQVGQNYDVKVYIDKYEKQSDTASVSEVTCKVKMFVK